MQYAIYEDILTALSSFYGRVRVQSVDLIFLLKFGLE